MKQTMSAGTGSAEEHYPRTDVRGRQVEPLYLSLLVTEPEVPLVIPKLCIMNLLANKNQSKVSLS